MDELILTDKGEKRLTVLRDKFYGPLMRDWEIEDYLVLNGIRLGAEPVSDSRSEYAPILRRLFEAGYIDRVDQ